MKKWKKAGVVCAAILAASMTVTACGGGKAESGNNATEKTETGAGGAKETGKASGGTAAISFSWWGNDDRHQATQNAIDTFNAAHAGPLK